MLKLRLILILTLAVLGLTGLAFKLRLLPERYDVRHDLSGVAAFWHEDEAFVFVFENTMGHRHSWLTDQAPGLLRLGLMAAGLEEWRPFGSSATAHRIVSGRLEQHELQGAPMMPAWDLENGALVARPTFEEGKVTGFRWDGSGFARLPAPSAPDAGPRRLTAETDDEAPREDDDPSLSSDAKERLAAAGWRYRRLYGYEAAGQPVELPIELSSGAYTLTLATAPPDDGDPMSGLRVKVTLTAAADQSSRALFAAEGWTGVSRTEFDRLAEGSPLPRPIGEDSAWPALFGYVNWVVGGLLVVWLLLSGPTRAVKIVFVIFVLLWAVPFARTEGVGRALVLFAIPVAVGLGSTVVSTQLLSYGVKRQLLPVGEDACPSFALRRVKELTAAFDQLGFRPWGDRQSTWRMMSSERKTFIRFLRHQGGHTWAEIHANENPRMVGRLLASIKGDTHLLTCDLQSNQELLREPHTVAQRVPRATHCGEMVSAHDAFLTKTAEAFRAIDDPVASSIEAYDRWVDGLRRLRQISVDGERFKISLRAAVPIAFRVIKAWFH